MKDDVNKDNVFMPLVSVVVITYNSVETVIETLESIKNQTYENLELIVSDDCSTDSTVEICEKWLSANENRFVRAEIMTSATNTGIPANLNRAIISSKGEWIKQIAADDALMPGCIDGYVKFIRRNGDAEVLFSHVFTCLNEVTDVNIKCVFPSQKAKILEEKISAKEQFEILLRDCPVPALSLFFKKKVFEKVGFYDESLRFCEDRPMFLKITKAGIRLFPVTMVCGKYRIHDKSVQKKKSSCEDILSEYNLEKYEYYLQHYTKYLSLLERLSVFMLYKRDLLLARWNINKKVLPVRIFRRITHYPWVWIVQLARKKYI